MKRELQLRRRLRTLRALHDAVGAMRSLSAHHLRLARQALPAGRTYRNEIERIVAEVGIPPPRHATAAAGLLVVASDLGLCGDYNQRLAHLAAGECTRYGVRPVFVVGRRARSSLQRAGIAPRRFYGAPASLSGASQLLLTLAQDLLEEFVAARLGSLHVVSARFDGVGQFSPLSVRVLPIEPQPATAARHRSPYVPFDHLAAVAVREFLYITLHEILLDALAAEHGMRLMATESALQWLDNASQLTQHRLVASRNETSTQELLDIIAGGARRGR